MGSTVSLFFPPKSLFSVEQIPDLTGQIIIVTGKPRADDAIEWLKTETGGKIAVFLELDLANLASVRRAAEEFKSDIGLIVSITLHASQMVDFYLRGVMYPPVNHKTSDGYDLQFGTNVLGHYLFTTILLPTLIHTAKNSATSGGHARVVNTSSAAIWHPPAGGIAWETLGSDEASQTACRSVGTIRLYGQSKLLFAFKGNKQGNVLFSNELARRYAEQGIISISLHPGAIKSELQRHIWVPESIKEFFMDLALYPASQGALTQLYAGTFSEVEHLNGKFLVPWAREMDPGPLANNAQLAQKLWSWCEEQAKRI
ncbi:hypothetical protein FRC10_002027 [Ceratobasidium sp. 414]|nr:hypothetical protein FRC10_002027 [Ceratobasidium sp. 414]